MIMRKWFILLLLRLYIKWIRPCISKFCCSFYKRKIPNEVWLEATKKWHEMRERSFFDFLKTINGYQTTNEYFFLRRSFFWYLVDFSFDKPEYFFMPVLRMRKCEYCAKMFYFWAEHHKYSVWEIFVINDFDLKTVHTVTVMKWFDKKYYLCYCKLYGSFDTLEKAIGYLLKWEYDPKKFVWLIGKKK